MNETVLYILQAYSIPILLLLFILYYFNRRKRALERELSIRKKQIEKEISQEKERLEQELSQKRIEYNTQIESQKSEINTLLEDYKMLKTDKILREIADYRAKLEQESQAKLDYQLDIYVQRQLDFEDKVMDFELEIQNLQKRIEELKSIEASAIEVRKRDALKNDAYHLHLSDEDKIEIRELRSIAAKFGRIRAVLLKAIYDIYYLPEVKRLVSRVLPEGTTSGIYKITSRVDGRVYIGKSVDIRKRWYTHFKRAAGVETETQNLLYPAMREQGLENFSFEIVEEVDNDSLSAREKYWQDFYKAKEHGFSVR